MSEHDQRWTQMRDQLQAFEQRIAEGFAIDPHTRDARLRARTDDWAKAPRVEQADAWLEVLRVEIGSETYALETRHVTEVVPLAQFTPLPGTPPWVLGIVNVRGRIVSVVDLRVLFELPINGLSDKNFLVIVQGPDMELGLLVDRVRAIVPLEKKRVQPGLASLVGVREQYLLGVSPEQWTVLDGARLLADAELRIDSGFND